MNQTTHNIAFKATVVEITRGTVHQAPYILTGNFEYDITNKMKLNKANTPVFFDDSAEYLRVEEQVPSKKIQKKIASVIRNRWVKGVCNRTISFQADNKKYRLTLEKVQP